MDKPLISVTIPAFKVRFLKEAIDSILAQNYVNYEIIIVNDASSENIDDVINAYTDSHIRYYKNEKGFGGYNVVGNWNRCLDLVNGDYIICMGDDDMLKQNCLSLYAEAVTTNPDLDVFHIRTEIINERNEPIDLQESRPTHESVYSMIWNLWKGRDQFIGDFLFKTKPLREKGGFYFLPYAWSSDKITVYLAASSKGICNINKIGFSYRRTNVTITNSSSNQQGRYVALLGEKKWYEQFLEKADIPDNELDCLYLNLIKAGYENYMQQKLDKMLSWDLTDSPSHIFYWLRKRKEYHFSTKYCLRIVKIAISAIFSKLLRVIFHHY